MGPVLITMKFGLIKVRYKGEEKVFTVAGGIVEVQPDQVTILADSAENVEEIDYTGQFHQNFTGSSGANILKPKTYQP